MNKRKMIFVVALLGIFVFIGATADVASAQTAFWRYCKITKAGVGGAPVIRVQFCDNRTVTPTGNYSYEVINSDDYNRIVAVALTALSNGSVVEIKFTPDASVRTSIEKMHVYDTPPTDDTNYKACD